jgi:putative peptidoglycan binding protein/transglycosylase-like protein with SLT domain
MSGVGAWSFGFYHKGMIISNERVAAGVIAFKHALIDNGYGVGINLAVTTFGESMRKQTVAFQKAKGIGADGVIGPTTARYLFRLYSYQAENSGTVLIPDHLLQRLGAQESGHDPVAQGYFDFHDEGWAQINLISHPQVTQSQAWKPSFAIQWAGNYIKSFYVNTNADWDGAIASYNIGVYYANKWVEAGKPTNGGPIVSGFDMWLRATNYVHGVKSRDA